MRIVIGPFDESGLLNENARFATGIFSFSIRISLFTASGSIARSIAVAILLILFPVLLIVAVVVAALRHIDLIEDHAEEADAGTVELLLRTLEHAAGGHFRLGHECGTIRILREDRGIDDRADRRGVEDHDVVVLFLDRLEELIAHLVLEKLRDIRCIWTGEDHVEVRDVVVGIEAVFDRHLAGEDLGQADGLSTDLMHLDELGLTDITVHVQGALAGLREDAGELEGDRRLTFVRGGRGDQDVLYTGSGEHEVRTEGTKCLAVAEVVVRGEGQCDLMLVFNHLFAPLFTFLFRDFGFAP